MKLADLGFEGSGLRGGGVDVGFLVWAGCFRFAVEGFGGKGLGGFWGSASGCRDQGFKGIPPAYTCSKGV